MRSFLRLFGHHRNVNDAHRAGANRLQNRRVFIQEEAAPIEDRFLTGRQVAWMIYEYFKVTYTNESVLDLNEFEGRIEERQRAVVQHVMERNPVRDGDAAKVRSQFPLPFARLAAGALSVASPRVSRRSSPC